MEEGITLEDVYKMLGERDVLIYKLQLELVKSRTRIKEAETQLELRDSEAE